MVNVIWMEVPNEDRDNDKREVNSSLSVPTSWPFELRQGFILSQDTSQCCRCCCLQPNINWTVGPYRDEPDIRSEMEQTLRIFEDATCCGRTCSYCLPAFRETSYTVYQGDDSTTPLYRHKKDWTCGSSCLLAITDNGPVRMPCCCCLPYLDSYEVATNRKIGSTRLICNCSPLWCPKFAVYNSLNEPQYLLQPDLCCCQQCIRCHCNCQNRSTKCCYIPYHIRDYQTKEKLGDEATAMTDLWAGLRRECCTRRDIYAVKFPTSFSDDMRATMIGATLLYDITLREQEN